MGFEARAALLEVLDQAIADTGAQVRVIAYDLNEPEVVSRLEQLKNAAQGHHRRQRRPREADSAETAAAKRLSVSAGAANVKRQHLRNLQHNKTIVVDGPAGQVAACGSTNFSWRAFFVQNNTAMILRGASPVTLFSRAFDNFTGLKAPAAFGAADSAHWAALGLAGIDAQVAFSPHAPDNALSLRYRQRHRDEYHRASLFHSLAFLYQTTGPILDGDPRR